MSSEANKTFDSPAGSFHDVMVAGKNWVLTSCCSGWLAVGTLTTKFVFFVESSVFVFRERFSPLLFGKLPNAAYMVTTTGQWLELMR